MQQVFQNIYEQVVNNLEVAVTAYGKEMVATVQQDLSTPYPPASAPGESPHKRTGALAEGVSSECRKDFSSITLTIKSERVGDNPDVPAELNYGTPHMAPRPYWEKAKAEVQTNAVRDIGLLMKR